MTGSMRRTLTVTVPGEALSSALFRMQRLNGQWASHGLPVWECQSAPDGDDRFTLTLDADLPTVAGHQVLGLYQRGAGFYPAPGADPADLADLGAGPDADLDVCAQCGTRRAKSHYVLAAPDGTVSAVAPGCVETFLLAADPAQPLARADLLREALGNPAELLSSTVANVESSLHVDTNAVIAAAMWLTEEQGYINRDRADRLGLRSTAAQIETLAQRVDDNGRVQWPEPVTSHFLPAAVLRAWAMEEMPEDSDYASRLKAAIARPTVTRHSYGIIAALPVAYRRASREEAAHLAGDPIPGQDYADGHVGTVGERMDLDGVIVEEVRGLDSGLTLVRMRGPQGHQIVWFTSTARQVPEPGSHTRLTGTVKAHREFRGVTETVMNRCKFSRP